MFFQELIPEHIPNGYYINKQQLAPVNDELRKLSKRALPTFILALVGVGGLSAIFVTCVKGTVGNILAAVIWIFYPFITSLILNFVPIGLKRSCAEIGLNGEALNAALKNRTDDTRAWGDSVTLPIYHRFTCKKCKKQTDWFQYPLISCTNETMQKKLEDFKYNTDVKKKYYENKRGFARYSLERTCPYCGKKQKKSKPEYYFGQNN